MWQDHREVVQFAFDAADHADRLSEVDLRVPRRMSERYEHLPRPALLLPDIVGDDDDAACEPVLVAQTLENRLRRVPLLLQLGFVLLQYLVNDRNEGIKLRSDRRLRPTIPRRHRVLQYLRDRLAVDVEQSHRLALAHSLNMARKAYPVVKLHSIHLPAFSSLPQAQDAEFYSATVRSPDRSRCPFCLRDSHLRALGRPHFFQACFGRIAHQPALQF